MFSKIALASVATALVVSGSFGFADELPVLQKGMWEYTRSVPDPANSGKTLTLTSRKCASPSEDWKQQNDMLTKMGCKFSPVTKDGNQYSFTADCNVQSPGGTPVSSKSTTVITIESADAFTVHVDSTTNGKKSVEELKAKRAGDCK